MRKIYLNNRKKALLFPPPWLPVRFAVHCVHPSSGHRVELTKVIKKVSNSLSFGSSCKCPPLEGETGGGKYHTTPTLSILKNTIPNLILIIFLSLSLNITTTAQEPEDFDIYTVIYLDSLTVTAKRKGFDAKDFINLVQEDESFYSAFRNLRTKTYHFDSNIKMKNKKGIQKAAYESQMIQVSDGDCRTMEIEMEKADGNFYKRKKKYRYYTMKMLDRLFYTHERFCESSQKDQKEKDSKMDQYVSELKQLIFNPGDKINVPFIGNKTEIFSKKMAPYYDYAITSQQYVDGRDCYVFSVRVKPKYQKEKEGKTVIKFLETYFDKKNFQVIARNYQLTYSNLAFSFDVTMNVQLTRLGQKYFPTLVKYNGRWDVPGKKPEIGTFTIKLYDFE